MSKPTNYTAYVDETGTNALDTASTGETNLFICTAVLIKEEDKENISQALSEISSRLCGGAEIKSSKIGKDHNRRVKFLREIQELCFSYYALIVNKDMIPRESGLRYKKSYYKFINKMLYERIAKEYSNLHVVADTIGGQAYMDSYAKYLKSKMPNLVSKFTHEFQKSSATPLLQLADLITGTLSFCFVDSKKGPHSEIFRQIIRTKEIHIEAWPLLRADSSESHSHHRDEAFLESARNRAVEFVEKNRSSSDPFLQMQGEVVYKLLFHQIFDPDNGGCLSTSYLQDYIEKLGFERPSEVTFRSKIIGKIRDSGVILSGTSKGYRLAVSKQDIQDYLTHNKNIIEPMLSRLKCAQRVIKADIDNNLDILKNENFFVLKSLVECYYETTLDLSTKRKNFTNTKT